MRFLVEPVEQPHFASIGVRRRNPMDVALDLVGVGARRAGLAVRKTIAMHFRYPSRGVFCSTRAFDDETVAQPHLIAGKEPKVAFARRFHEVLALYPQFLRKRDRAFAPVRFLRMVRRMALLGLVGWIIVDYELDRIEHCDAAR